MFAPLSGKQQREWLKFSGKESRESAKMENDEKRKERLHEIKLREAAAKAEQGLGHKDELHGIKIEELSGPLGKKPRMNRQKLGLPSSNPMSGTGMFKQGQHMLAQGTDTVPAMLTPGEAVIPRAAAQDPRNKPMIAKMVQQGRQAQRHARGTTGVIDIPHQLAMLPTIKPTKKRMGYEDGTLDAQDEQMYNPDKYAEGSMNIVQKDGIPMMHGGYVPHYEDGVESVSGYDVGGGFNPAGIQDNPEDRFQRAMKGTEWYGEFNKEYNEPPDLSRNANYDYRKAWDAGIMPERSPEDNNKYHWPSSTSNGSMLKSADHPTAWKEYYMRATGRNPDTEDGLDEATMRNVADKYKIGQEGQPKPVDISEKNPVPKAVVPTPVAVPLVNTASQVNNMDRVANPEVPPTPPDLSIDTVSEVNNMDRVANPEAIPSVSRSLTPPPPKAPIEDRTNPEYWIKSFKGANSDVDKAADRYKNDDKGFIESFKDIFSYKGLKDTLGLNNQEIARMAVMYLGSRARGYNGAKSLSFAGRNAFETSLQRQGRESAEIAADRRAEKSDERAVRTAAVSMAGQASRDIREDERIKQRYELEDNRIAAAERKAETLRIYGENKDARKEVENDMDRLENSLAKNVPTAVRKKAIEMAYAPLKSETPEAQRQERRNNLRNANLFVSSNVLHKDPESGRHDRVAKYDYYEDAKGNPVYAAPDPYGSGKMYVQDIKGNVSTVPGASLRKSGTTAKQAEYAMTVVDKHLSGMKDEKNKPIDTKIIGAKVISAAQDFPGLIENPYAANAAIEAVVKNLDTKNISSEGIRKAMAGAAVMTLNPTRTELFVDHKNNKAVSGVSTVEFGDAISKAKDKDGKPMPLEEASQYYMKRYDNLPPEDKQKILTKEGYSRFQSFVIRDVNGTK